MATIDKEREAQFLRYTRIHLRGAQDSMKSALSACAPHSERARELTEIKSVIADLVYKIGNLT